MLCITSLWVNSEFNRGKSGQEVKRHCPSLEDAEARGKAPADFHGTSQRRLCASNTRQDEEAQLGREQTDELAGKHTQPSTNKPLSAGLRPADPARPSCRSVKPELSWRLHNEHPAAIPWLPTPPARLREALNSCPQVGMCA